MKEIVSKQFTLDGYPIKDLSEHQKIRSNQKAGVSAFS